MKNESKVNSPFAKPSSSSQPFPFFSSSQDNSFDNKRLNPIDVLLVDKQSRLTLTKRVKKVIPLNPEDKITVYQDIYNKDIVLKVQYHKEQNQEAEEEKLENWILTIRKEVNNPNKKKANVVDNNNLANDNDNSSEDNQKIQKSDIYKLKNKENSLYSTPILLVDDDSDLLMVFKLFLNSEGYKNIKTFSDSRLILKHLSELKSSSYYRLAILDIRMPEINGIQLYQILKILNPSIEILFLTGLDAVNELTSMYSELKSMDILRKPIDQNQFIRAVNGKVTGLTGVYD